MLNNSKLRILLSLVHNYPVIKYFHGSFVKIIVIVSDKSTGMLLQKLNLTGRNQILCSDTNKEQLVNALCVPRSAFCIYHYEDNSKGKMFLNSLSRAVSEGYLYDKEIMNIPIVLMESGVVALDIINCFALEEDTIFSERVTLNMVIPQSRKMEVIRDRINEYVEIYDGVKSVLQTAACFLPECIENRECLGAYLETVEAMLMDDDNIRDTSGISDIFLNALLSWQRATHFCDVRQLPDIEPDDVGLITEVILYDDSYIYMKEELFRIIAETINDCSSNLIKSALKHDDILVTNNTTTFSVKVSYYSAYGQFKRLRMLKFRRDLICTIGEVDFITRCLNSKEEQFYEN